MLAYVHEVLFFSKSLLSTTVVNHLCDCMIAPCLVSGAEREALNSTLSFVNINRIAENMFQVSPFSMVCK